MWRKEAAEWIRSTENNKAMNIRRCSGVFVTSTMRTLPLFVKPSSVQNFCFERFPPGFNSVMASFLLYTVQLFFNAWLVNDPLINGVSVLFLLPHVTKKSLFADSSLELLVAEPNSRGYRLAHSALGEQKRHSQLGEQSHTYSEQGGGEKRDILAEGYV